VIVRDQLEVMGKSMGVQTKLFSDLAVDSIFIGYDQTLVEGRLEVIGNRWKN